MTPGKLLIAQALTESGRELEAVAKLGQGQRRRCHGQPAGPDQTPGEGNGSVHGGCCVTYQPKGSMCMVCQNRREDCSRLPFDTMRVVESIKGGSVQIVRCSEYVKEVKQ